MKFEPLQFLLAIPAVWIVITLIRGLNCPRSIFLCIFGGAFFISNYLGLLLPADTLASFAGYDITGAWLFRAGWNYLPFLGAIAVVVHFQSRQNRERAATGATLNRLGVIFCLAGLAAASGMTLFYLVQGGWAHAKLWMSVSGIESAYRIRYDAFAEGIRYGLSSSLAAFGVIPTLGAVLLVTRNAIPFGLRLLILAPPFALAFVRSLATLQRGAPVVQIVTVSIILLVALSIARGTSARRTSLVRLGVAFGLGALIFLFAGVSVFERAGALDSAFYRVIERVIAIPAHTGALYFGYFPDYLQFRGAMGTFLMPLGDFDDFMSGDVSIKLIGYLANGYPHNANANFIATAYSGLGTLSVLAISGLMFGVIYWFSRKIGAYGLSFALAASVAQLQGVYFLTQADFVASITAGFWIGFILIGGMIRLNMLSSNPLGSAGPRRRAVHAHRTANTEQYAAQPAGVEKSTG